MRAQGVEINNNELVFLPQFVEDPAQFSAGENGRWIRRPRVGNRREERHLGRLILPNNVLERCSPKSEFDNSTICAWGHGARQRRISEVTVNKDDGSAVSCDQLGDRQRDSRLSLVWSRGGNSTTLADLDLFSKSIANFIERKPSENRENG